MKKEKAHDQNDTTSFLNMVKAVLWQEHVCLMMVFIVFIDDGTADRKSDVCRSLMYFLLGFNLLLQYRCITTQIKQWEQPKVAKIGYVFKGPSQSSELNSVKLAFDLMKLKMKK